MKAEKLKSGRWRVRVYIGRREDGSQIVKSVSADTEKEAMRKAMSVQYHGDDLSVQNAIEMYMDVKKDVLSPTSYRGYCVLLRNNIIDRPIAHIMISKLTDPIVQKWVSSLARSKSPKTVRNAYGLFSVAVTFFFPRTVFNVKLPQSKKPVLHTPTTAEVERILEYCKGHNYELYKAVLLSAVCMMRQGEILALTADDIDRENCRIFITKSMALASDNEVIIKQPKSISSNRTIFVPQFVIDALPTEGRIVNLSIHYLSTAFCRMVRKVCDNSFRFHDLRHYAASIAASSSVGASMESIKARGGWSTDSVMKRVYINRLEDEEVKDSKLINEYFQKQFGE